jgi:plasmid maintenance system antidote protein VapI
MLEAKTQDGSGVLFDNLIAAHDLKNDAGLARALEVAPPVISKIRHHRALMGATLMITIHEKFDMPIAEIRTQLKGEAA